MYPKKLKDDSIVEAICHLHFQSTEVSEIVVGRLSDDAAWGAYSRQRLPVADIPAPVREADENLRFEPLLQLRAPDGSRLVKIGDRTISYHVTGRYCGWTVLKPELERVFDGLFNKLGNPIIRRIGFRYINALTAGRHFIGSVDDLNLMLKVDDKQVTAPVNLNFQVTNSPQHLTMTRVASPEFVKGFMPERTAAVVDVDVFTPVGFETSELSQVRDWVETAHNYEKEAFFRLIPKHIQSRLAEE